MGISACVPPTEAKPNPNSKCTPPMVNEDPEDMTSKCLTPSKVIYIITPDQKSECVQPKVNEDPEDMKSKCVKPSEAKPNPKSKCTKNMVNIDPLEMNSKCVPISAITPKNTPKPNPKFKMYST